MKLPHNRIEISRSALNHNLGVAKQLAGEGCLVAPCIKGNAYGHGLLPVALTLTELGADSFCVFTVEEGIVLRTAGILVPILVLGYVDASEMDAVITHNLHIFVDDIETAKDLNAAAEKRNRVMPVHLKIDTGMGRFGILYEELPHFLEAYTQLHFLQTEGVASHFATSDQEGENKYFHIQFERYQRALQQLAAVGIYPTIRHIANSAAVLRYPEVRLDMIRPGRMIYGYLPHPEDVQTYAEQGIVLQQVITVKSVVAQVKKVPAGMPVSYGGTYVTERESILAIIPIGYADGISRFLSNIGSVLIGGKRAPIRGKVCMNAFTVDVTDIPGVLRGDEVVVLGKQGDAEISCYEMAELLMHTLPYNVLTAFQDSLPRIVID